MKPFRKPIIFIVMAVFVHIVHAEPEKNLDPIAKNNQQVIAQSPQEAIDRLIKAYSSSDLKSIKNSLGAKHRFGSNIIDGLQWLGNCLTIMKQCIKTPVETIETKQVGTEVAVAVLAKNLLGAPMSVWFITSLEKTDYKVTGMNTRLECALKTPEQIEKERKERKKYDYWGC